MATPNFEDEVVTNAMEEDQTIGNAFWGLNRKV